MQALSTFERSLSGDRARGRADRLAPGRERPGPRPRGPARDLPQHADHPRRRGARAHPLPAREDPGVVLHGPRQRSRVGRGGDCDGPRRRRYAVASRHGRAHHARRRAVADLRAVHGPRGWADARQGRQRPHGRRAPRSARDGQPPAGDVARGGRLRARVPHPRGAARGGGVVGRRRDGARRRARGHEPRRRAQAPGGLHLRQQPVGVLDADTPRVRRRASRRSRTGLRVRRRRRRRHRRARCVPRGEACHREGARRRRPDADRVPDAAHGGPRRARRRVLRPQGALRAVGRARPDRALPLLAPRPGRHDGRRGKRDRRLREEAPQRRAAARGGVAPARPVDAHGRRLRDAGRPRHPPPQVAMPEKTYLQAISDGLRQEMRRDKRVFVMGEDVGVYGGAFKVTLGFQEEFGSWRVLDMPLSETAIMGAATGAAIMGMRPVAEMQFADFVSCAWDHLVTIAAKQRWRAGTPVPIVLRLPSGGFSGGPFHSQNPESSFAHIPGLKCVCPATPEDAKGLLVSAIEDPNPVLFFEHKHLYRRIKADVPDERYTTPFGEARLHREGSDVTVITWGAMVYTADEAAQRLEQEDVSVEIVDLRTLIPWDRETVLGSVARCSKALVLHEDTRTGGFGAEIAATIAEDAFEELDAPVRRLAAPDCPVPFAPQLEKAFIPQVDDVAAGLRELAEY